MKKIIILFILIYANLFAAGWTDGKIKEIYPAPAYNGILIKQETMINPDNCASSTYYLLKKDNPLFNEIYSLIISAQARESNIKLNLVNCKGVDENANTLPSIFQVISY